MKHIAFANNVQSKWGSWQKQEAADLNESQWDEDEARAVHLVDTEWVNLFDFEMF